MQVKYSLLVPSLLLLCAVQPVIAQTQYPYNVIPLQGAANAINDLNQIACTEVAQVNGKNYVHAEYYQNGVYHDAQAGQAVNNYGEQISNSGLLACNEGYPYIALPAPAAPSLYNINTGQTRQLTQYTSLSPGNIEGINASGDAVVEAGGIASIYHYSTNTIQTIVTPGNLGLLVTGINDAGVVIGQYGGHAFYYTNGTYHFLPSLVGIEATYPFSINNNGDIVGTGYVSELQHDSFLYHNGQIQDLGFFNTLTSGNAAFINNEGVIVGGSGDCPFIYQNGKMQNLLAMIDPSLGITDGGARAINDNGWILDSSSQGDFLLVPNPAFVPEPGSLLTCAVGVGVMSLAARRRKRTA